MYETSLYFFFIINKDIIEETIQTIKTIRQLKTDVKRMLRYIFYYMGKVVGQSLIMAEMEIVWDGSDY